MAAADNYQEVQYPEELRLSLSSLGIVPNYSNVEVYQSEQSDSIVAGVGLRALANIPFGFPIISESALFSKAKNVRVSRTQAELDDFRELSCPTNPRTSDNVFAANSFGMGKTGNKENQGIFPIASRLNHSCVPNAYFAWNWKSKTLTVHALTPIPSGQEILVNYRVLNYLKTGLSAVKNCQTTTTSSVTVRLASQTQILAQQVRIVEQKCENSNSKSKTIGALLCPM